ncbi:hypothetical protein HNQ57_000461 [Zhongshania antarctica]|uniref:Uncharacterized protein n=1 Tax=Zhongshania antarctica TaxID=641702 RepID=A0A840R147_9GAMM|nr:hypothetical protein [Zhongshania antarctica]MBB5186202.1 hypothetical protein [Zhongshania antarctica]
MNTEKRIKVGDIELAVQEFGDAGHQAIVLIMGLGMPMVSWPESFCVALAA